MSETAICRCLQLSAVVVALSANVHAADLVPRASLGMAWSDNALRNPSGAQDETVLAAEVGFAWQRTGPRLLSDLTGSYARREYLNNSFDPENLFNVRGYLDTVIVPERLDWVVEENFGQIATLPFGAILPIDREDANYFTTGPNVSFGLAGGDSLDFYLRASDVYYSESNADNQRVGAQASYSRALSPRRRLSANYYIGRVEFDENDLYPAFDTQQFFFRLESQARRMTLAADLGWNGVKFRGERDSGAFAQFTAFRRINPETLVTLQYSRGFSNSADAFRVDQSSLGGSRLDEDVRVTADPFDEDRLTASYQLNRARTELRLSAYGSRERYLDSVVFDRDQLGLEGQLGYRLSSLTTLSLIGRFEDNELIESGVKTRDTQLTVEFGLQATPAVIVRFAVEQYRRNVRSGPLAEYTENRVFAGVSYAPPLPPRPQRLFRGRSLVVPSMENALE